MLSVVAHRPAMISSVDVGPGLDSTPAISNMASWHRGLTTAPAAVAESGVVAVTLAICQVSVWLAVWPVVLLGTWHSRVIRRNAASRHGASMVKWAAKAALVLYCLGSYLQGVRVLVFSSIFQQPSPYGCPVFFHWYSDGVLEFKGLMFKSAVEGVILSCLFDHCLSPKPLSLCCSAGHRDQLLAWSLKHAVSDWVVMAESRI